MVFVFDNVLSVDSVSCTGSRASPLTILLNVFNKNTKVLLLLVLKVNYFLYLLFPVVKNVGKLGKGA